MAKHKKVYFSHFDYVDGDFIACEMCGKPAVDIHHINARGMGGTKKTDEISNLMALCRKCHLFYGDKKQYKELLQNRHNKILANS